MEITDVGPSNRLARVGNIWVQDSEFAPLSSLRLSFNNLHILKYSLYIKSSTKLNKPLFFMNKVLIVAHADSLVAF